MTYTPSTDWVRTMVGHAKTTIHRTLPPDAARQEGYDWFNRWLAAHDHEVRAAAFQEWTRRGGGMTDVAFELIDPAFPEPTEQEIRRHRNRRPHCARCGSFMSAKTLHYVNQDDLLGDCPHCGPDVRLAME